MRKATASYRTYLIPGKTATLVPEFAVEDLPLSRTAALIPEFASEGPALGQNTVMMIYTNQSINQSSNHSVLPRGRSFTANSAFSTLPSSHSTFSYLHPSAGSSFLASGPADFFSSSLSVPALFFLHPLFLAKLHFYFVCPSFSISASEMLPVFLLTPS